MKTFYFITICFILISNSLYSQDTIETKKRYETDTLQGRHFGDFVKPIDKDGIIFNSQENEQPAYFKKCGYLKINEERNKCFSETFYEVLRKNISFNGELLKEKNIHFNVKFTISKLGEFEKIEFVDSNDSKGEFEKEIIRVLKKMPKIIPFRKNNKFVNSTYIFPIEFNK